MTSQARIDANRRNAQSSTGPKSRTGKDRSKMNRLDHGLRAAEFVLPTEDLAAFQAHMDAWMDDWKPKTMAQRELVEKMALAAWRRKRVVRVEAQRLSERVNAALSDFDRRERAALRRDVRTLLDDPARGLAALRATRAGVEKLIAMWSEIAEAVAEPGRWLYGDVHHEPLIALLGLREDDEDEEAVAVVEASWRLLLRDRPDIDPSPFVPWTDEEAPEVRERIGDLADEALDRLEALHDRLPDRASERARRAEVAAFEPRPEDAPLLRYEGQLDREFHRGLAALTKLVKSDADPVEDAPAADPGAQSSPENSDATTDISTGSVISLGSFGAEAGTPPGTGPAGGRTPRCDGVEAAEGAFPGG